MMLIERFSSTGAIDPLSVIKAVNSESSSEVESILTDGLEAISQMQADLEERKVAAQEQANEIAAKQMEIPLEVAKIKAETDITVKEMDITGQIQKQNTDLEHKENMQTEQSRAKLDEVMLSQANAEEMQENGNVNEN